MFFSRKKKILDRFSSSFGKLKDDSFNFTRIEDYFRKKDQQIADQILSDKTCNDLDPKSKAILL